MALIVELQDIRQHTHILTTLKTHTRTCWPCEHFQDIEPSEHLTNVDSGALTPHHDEPPSTRQCDEFYHWLAYSSASMIKFWGSIEFLSQASLKMTHVWYCGPKTKIDQYLSLNDWFIWPVWVHLINSTFVFPVHKRCCVLWLLYPLSTVCLY